MSITRHDVDGNKAKVRSFIDAWNNWDFTRFQELMADSFLPADHGGLQEFSLADPGRPVDQVVVPCCRHRHRRGAPTATTFGAPRP
jgi:hypothetical protein